MTYQDHLRLFGRFYALVQDGTIKYLNYEDMFIVIETCSCE